SVSADASLVCFVSDADNLIFGDANGVADAFVAHRTPANQKPPPTRPPPSTTFTITNPNGPAPLQITTKREKDGSMLLAIHVPGAGKVSVLARATGKHHPAIARAFGTARKKGVFRVRLRLLSRYANQVKRGRPVHATITVTWSPKAPKVPKKRSFGLTFKRASALPKNHRHR